MIVDIPFIILILVSTISRSIWFFYYFGLYAFEITKYSVFNGTVGVIVPIYNEDLDSLTKTIGSLNNADSIKEIIYVNDCSPIIGTCELINKLKRPQDRLIDLKVNGGKRNAQKSALSLINTEIVIFIDSDTIINKDAITEISKPFNDSEIGGVCGRVLVENEKTNLITKTMASSWQSARIWRQSSSNYGYFEVCSGALSGYRKKFLDKLMKEYTTQKFLDSPCHISDDRWLTIHIQTEFNKRIEYVHTAVCFTHTPDNIKGTYKMLRRWSLGAMRETLLMYDKVKLKPVLVFDSWLNLTLKVIYKIMNLLMIITLFFEPSLIPYYLCNICIGAFIYSIDLIFESRRHLIPRMGYSLLNELIYSWTVFDAILRIKQQGVWGTRA